jgi:PTS system nitrogen regulatory IIA component
MDPNLVCFIDVDTRQEALQEMVDMLYYADKLKDKEQFLKAILDREKVVSTGIGLGVAIPHAKLPDYPDFFIAIAISKKGIDWNALDNAAVRLIFMIGGPDDKQTEYLQLLSHLTMAIKDEERRKKLLTLNSKEAIIQLFLA